MKTFFLFLKIWPAALYGLSQAGHFSPFKVTQQFIATIISPGIVRFNSSKIMDDLSSAPQGEISKAGGNEPVEIFEMLSDKLWVSV